MADTVIFPFLPPSFFSLRTGRSALIAYPNQHPRHFLFAPSARHRHCQFTALCGRRVTCCRKSISALSPIAWINDEHPLRQLFGEEEDSGNELDDAEKQGENGKELSLCSESHPHTLSPSWLSRTIVAHASFFPPFSSRDCHPEKGGTCIQSGARCLADATYV